MPVFEDQRVDTGGVESHGRGSAAAMGGGVSVVGLIVYLLMNVLGGGDRSSAFQLPSGTQIAGTGESAAEMQTRCNTSGAIEKYNDCYLVKVYNEINEVWTDEIKDYERPRLAFYQDSVQTACGSASSNVGPFYCPGDREIYIDLGFLQQLQKEYGANGRYAQAYILAHEAGHHIQTLFDSNQKASGSGSNEASIRVELQADCYAGVWGRKANDKGNVTITEAELDEALNAAAAVGDDRIQRKSQGQVDPETWTHGSAEQRRSWYLRGYRESSIDACDTFAG